MIASIALVAIYPLNQPEAWSESIFELNYRDDAKITLLIDANAKTFSMPNIFDFRIPTKHPNDVLNTHSCFSNFRVKSSSEILTQKKQILGSVVRLQVRYGPYHMASTAFFPNPSVLIFLYYEKQLRNFALLDMQQILNESLTMMHLNIDKMATLAKVNSFYSKYSRFSKIFLEMIIAWNADNLRRGRIERERLPMLPT